MLLKSRVTCVCILKDARAFPKSQVRERSHHIGYVASGIVRATVWLLLAGEVNSILQYQRVVNSHRIARGFSVRAGEMREFHTCAQRACVFAACTLEALAHAP